jgi:ABC-type amino acid transport substrate-binding protein
VAAALKAGQVAAALQDLPVNLYYATDATLAVTKQFTDQKESYGIAIPKGRSELKRAVDDAIKAIRGDDTYNTILRAYLGADYGKS